MGDTKAERKTWQQWNEDRIGGIYITDPTGFRDGDPMADHYSWTKAEFLEKRLECKVEGRVSPLREDANV